MSTVESSTLLESLELLRHHIVHHVAKETSTNHEDCNPTNSDTKKDSRMRPDSNKKSSEDPLLRLVERHFSLLHSKLDKLIRLQDDNNTQQKLMMSTLNSLVKKGVSNNECNNELGHKQDDNDNSEKSSSGVTTSTTKALAVLSPSLTSSLSASLSRTKPHWAQNMLMLGDDHIQGLMQHEASKMRQLQQLTQLKVVYKANMTFNRLYDERRAKLLEAIPLNTRSIVLSVSSVDLMSDPNLITLEQAHLDGVKATNEPILRVKCQHLLRAVKALQTSRSSDKRCVVVVLPAHGEERIEVFKQWEQLVEEELKIVPKVALVNLAKSMRESMGQFRRHEDYLTHWLGSKREKRRIQLSAHGAKKLLELIEDAVLYLENRSDLEQCLRCMREHVGGDAECRSINKACRTCGRVGHFSSLHSINDTEIRNRITSFLGEDIYSTGEQSPSTVSTAAQAVSKRSGVSDGTDDQGDDDESGSSKRTRLMEQFNVPEGEKDETLNGWYER